MALHFEWDPTKDAANQAKHGVAFEEAATVFEDEGALLIDDPEHSGEEERFILLGLSSRIKVLVVVHCYIDENDVIRIISAREATQKERQAYSRRS